MVKDPKVISFRLQSTARTISKSTKLATICVWHHNKTAREPCKSYAILYAIYSICPNCYGYKHKQGVYSLVFRLGNLSSRKKNYSSITEESNSGHTASSSLSKGPSMNDVQDMILLNTEQSQMRISWRGIYINSVYF